MKRRFYLLLGNFLAALVLAGCAAGTQPGSGDSVVVVTAEVSTAISDSGSGPVVPPVTPAPATPIPSLAGGLGPTELKYRLLDQFPLFYCDPDEYPVARGDEQDKAIAIFPELQANREEFLMILARYNLSDAQESGFTDEQKLAIYREHKRLAAIQMEVAGGDRYNFRMQSAEQEGNGKILSGVIDGQGKIKLKESQPSIATCPICLAAGARIDTPSGPVAVENLRAGDRVWTLSADGRRIAAPVRLAIHTRAPADHQVVRLVLDDGRRLSVSPGHPTADGRRAGDLRPGDTLDHARVVSAEREPYAGETTFDLLPDGETGFYWANGILMGSTLK